MTLAEVDSFVGKEPSSVIIPKAVIAIVPSKYSTADGDEVGLNALLSSSGTHPFISNFTLSTVANIRAVMMRGLDGPCV